MKKRFIIALLLMISLVVSGFTYAYWASSVTGDSDAAVGTVQVGSGDAVTINAVVNDLTTSGQILVPSGFANDPGEVEQVVLTFSVEWVDDNALTGIVPADITMTVSNVLVDGLSNSLVNVTPSVSNPTQIALGSTVTFIINVTLDQPLNVSEYNSVAGKTITFDLTFVTTPN